MTRGALQVYDATFVREGGDAVVIPVAASSLAHAARKAGEQEATRGECVALVKTDRVII